MLLNRKDLLTKFPGFKTAMTVYCSDGEKLGKIGSADENYFTVEKGIFFPKDFTLRYDDISEIRDDKLFILESSEEMKHWKEPGYAGWNKAEQVNAGQIEPIAKPEYKDRYESIAEDTIEVPIFEEELEVNKTMRSAGQVTVRKVVHSELKHLTVPLLHEDVVIERVKLDREAAGRFNSDESFKDSTVSMQLMDEEAEITKRPVVREEVRLSKTRNIEEKELSGEIRKEDVEVDDQSVRKTKRKAG
jgi:uncharacterized protein (TIGR02271 family)